MLGPLDVIWIDDQTIDPPGPKMVACVEAHLGFFFRINSRGNWQHSLPLTRDPDHLFLKRNSFLECGEPLELDDYIVDESLRIKGVVGTISATLAPQICAIILKATSISLTDKNAIKSFLNGP